jgi:hypothetical protein
MRALPALLIVSQGQPAERCSGSLSRQKLPGRIPAGQTRNNRLIIKGEIRDPGGTELAARGSGNRQKPELHARTAL